MNIIFQIDGGIGKSIMATAVCKAIKKQHPKSTLIVITAYPDVFLCNPNVDKCYQFNQLNYFYSNYIENNKVKIMAHNPYLETSFIEGKEHLIKTWCEMFGLDYDNEKPEIFLTEREKTFYSNQLILDKPSFVIQTNGGAENQNSKYSWARDIPIKCAQEVVDYFSKKYTILHIRRKDQLPLHNTLPIHSNFRNIAVLILNSSKRLFMDSFAQHTSVALGLNSVVCWVANSHKQFGYNNNINIQANEETLKPELKQSVYNRFNIIGDLTQFPYNDESEIFDTEKIIESLNIL